MTFFQIHVIINLESGYSNLFSLHFGYWDVYKPLCLSSIGVMVTRRSYKARIKVRILYWWKMPTTGYECVVCVRKSLQQYLIAPWLKNLQLLCVRRLRILGANSNVTSLIKQQLNYLLMRLVSGPFANRNCARLCEIELSPCEVRDFNFAP